MNTDPLRPTVITLKGRELKDGITEYRWFANTGLPMSEPFNDITQSTQKLGEHITNGSIFLPRKKRIQPVIQLPPESLPPPP